MQYTVVDMNEWLFPDEVTRADGSEQADILCVRGSFACFQLLLTGMAQGAISWRMNGGIPGCAHVRRLVPVYVQKNTGTQGFTAVEGEDVSAYVTRKAPFWVYDPMAELRGKYANYNGSDQNCALYVLLEIPRDAAAGVYTDELEVCIADQCCHVPVRVQISKACLPVKPGMGLIQWFGFDNMATYHGCEMWSEAHWQVIERYCRMMLHARQTHFWINKEIVPCQKLDDGGFRFNFDKAERFIRMCFDMGFTCLESGMAIERENYTDEHFIIRAGDESIPALSDRGYRYLHDYFTQLRQMLEKNGWLEKTVQHVADEPHEGCVQEYRVLSGIVRMLMPGVPLIDAIESAALFGSADILVPKNFFYEQNRERFELYRRLGNQLWVYTCCHPGGKYMNRTLDMSLLRIRYMHWACARYELSGYLHWGLNYYSYTDDPFCGKAGQAVNLGDVELPPGDTHILYPDTDRPMSSVRFEALRAGMEDFDLLHALREKDEAAYWRLLDTYVRGFGDFDASSAHFKLAYERLAEGASAQ